LVGHSLSVLRFKELIVFKATIKAGVTSLSQLIVLAALYPVYDVVLKLKVSFGLCPVAGCLVYSPRTIIQSEEFFRILSTRRMRGVSVAILDKISNPNYGSVTSLKDVVSSPSIYMGSALIATLISVAISFVTPAARE